jgi:hypothetical protein
MFAVIVQPDDSGALLLVTVHASLVLPKGRVDSAQRRQAHPQLFGLKDKVVDREQKARYQRGADSQGDDHPS